MIETISNLSSHLKVGQSRADLREESPDDPLNQIPIPDNVPFLLESKPKAYRAYFIANNKEMNVAQGVTNQEVQERINLIFASSNYHPSLLYRLYREAFNENPSPTRSLWQAMFP